MQDLHNGVQFTDYQSRDNRQALEYRKLLRDKKEVSRAEYPKLVRGTQHSWGDVKCDYKRGRCPQRSSGTKLQGYSLEGLEGLSKEFPASHRRLHRACTYFFDRHFNLKASRQTYELTLYPRRLTPCPRLIRTLLFRFLSVQWHRYMGLSLQRTRRHIVWCTMPPIRGYSTLKACRRQNHHPSLGRTSTMATQKPLYSALDLLLTCSLARNYPPRRPIRRSNCKSSLLMPFTAPSSSQP